jgi:hypothetical protein
MRNAFGADQRGFLVARALLGLLGVAAATGLIALSFSTHLQRACTVQDTPYLPVCPDEATISKPEKIQALRQRLVQSPGDSGAWVTLTNLESGAHERALFRASALLAPTDPNVQMWRAGDALSRNDLPQATALLVDLVDYRRTEGAINALAQIVASRDGTALLRPHLARASRWLGPVLASMSAQKLSLTSALPLLAEASARGSIPPQTIRDYIRALKADGQWADAYGLWLSQQRGRTPLLHNGGFEQRFQPDGFDWEVLPVQPSKAGAIAGQRNFSGHGLVFEVEFTGRPVAVPVVRQYVFLGPGKYVVRGMYTTSRLRMEQGLAWAVRCSNAKSGTPLAGRSEPLQDASNGWHRFQFTVSIGPDCGLVASLQLETFAQFEAIAGFKGRASFDALELVPQPL